MADTAAISMTWSNGFVGVSIQTMRVCGIRSLFQLETDRQCRQPARPAREPRLPSERSAVTIGLHDEMIARIQQAHDGVLGRQPTGECEPEVGTLKQGQMGLRDWPGWGCPDRAYSKPRSDRRASCSKVEDRYTGVLTAPVIGSARPPPCTALVSNPIRREIASVVHVPTTRAGGQSGEHVGASDDTHGMATIKNEQGRRSLQPPDGNLDLFSGPDSR